jgi:hypothetical protein
MDIQKIEMSSESIIRLAIQVVRHKFYNDKEISNYAKSQPLYRVRLAKAIHDIVDLIELNNRACEA